MKSLGRHIIAELYECNVDSIRNVKIVEKAMVGAAKATSATIVDIIFHSFNPYGVSGVIVIAESHLAIHTWPEYGLASVDIYTCGDEVQPWKAYEFLEEAFEAKNVSVMEIKRGIMSPKEGVVIKHKPDAS
ncbi:MAG: S-adenosylmethionine decarboxylase proenzyme [bacterium]|nr:S-adenosylmethionine decarboxylase proenzyme [bacterium]